MELTLESGLLHLQSCILNSRRDSNLGGLGVLAFNLSFWRDSHVRHLFRTTPSLNSMNQLRVVWSELEPPKIRKTAPLLSVRSV